MRLRFGEFSLDAGSRELRGPEGPIPLSPKAYAGLLALLERRPDAVSRQDLQDRLWPKTFVAETSLRRVIAELRAALGDDEGHPRFIRNVRGFGYAFCGQAEEAGAARRNVESSIACRLEWGRREIALREGREPPRTHPGRRGLDRLPQRVPTPRPHRGRGGEGDDRGPGKQERDIVSGRRIDAPTVLEGGDQIELGSVRMTYRVFHARGSTETRRSRG